jgi:hypothetical protein
MRSCFFAPRQCLVGFLAASLIALPAMAATEKPLGMVVTADHATLDNSKATAGEDVYPGDSLITDQGGSLRMKVGAGQVYLLSLSVASLEPQENKIQARVDRGTLGFSTPNPGQLEIKTPVGVIRGADSTPIFGQVSVINSERVRISAYEGTLVIDRDGDSKTIAPGETYDATLTPDPQGPPPTGAGSGGGSGISVGKIAAYAGPPVVLGLVACALWPESTSSTGCFN